MVYSIDSAGASAYSQYTSLFAKLDTDDDSKVTKSEFVAAAPEGIGADAASQLFDLLDQEGTGSLSESDLASAFEQLSNEMKSALLDAQEDKGPPPPPPGGMPDPSEMFASLDTDGDGTVTKEEFIAGRPDDVSEEQATAMFEELAGEGADSLTEDQFISAMESKQAEMGPPPPPPSGAETGTDTADTDTESSMIEQLLAAIQEEDENGASNAALVLQAAQAYAKAA